MRSWRSCRSNPIGGLNSTLRRTTARSGCFRQMCWRRGILRHWSGSLPTSAGRMARTGWIRSATVKAHTRGAGKCSCRHPGKRGAANWMRCGSGRLRRRGTSNATAAASWCRIYGARLLSATTYPWAACDGLLRPITRKQTARLIGGRWAILSFTNASCAAGAWIRASGSRSSAMQPGDISQ